MGFFSFRKNKKEESEQIKKANDQGKYLGDLEKTAILSRLFGLPHEQRDEKWKHDFLEHVAEASFSCGEPQIIQGPDGFPYFQLNIPESNKPFQCYVLQHMISDFILDRGIGVVINAWKGQPDWVFTYGDLVNFYSRGIFYSPVPDIAFKQEEVIDEQESVLVGQPSEHFLPVQARNIIRAFLEQQGINDAKIALMSRSYDDVVVQELVSNLTPQKVGMDRFEQLTNYLKWFLPRHYGMVAMDEDGSFKGDFQAI